MSRTVKASSRRDEAVKVCHHPDLEALEAHVLAFVAAYNFAKHPKRLRWRAPFQAVHQRLIRQQSENKLRGSRRQTPSPNWFREHEGALPMRSVDPELVNIPDAARMASISRSKLYEYIGAGELPTVKLGTRRLVRVESLRAWIKAKEVQGER